MIARSFQLPTHAVREKFPFQDKNGDWWCWRPDLVGTLPLGPYFTSEYAKECADTAYNIQAPPKNFGSKPVM